MSHFVVFFEKEEMHKREFKYLQINGGCIQSIELGRIVAPGFPQPKVFRIFYQRIFLIK